MRPALCGRVTFTCTAPATRGRGGSVRGRRMRPALVVCLLGLAAGVFAEQPVPKAPKAKGEDAAKAWAAAPSAPVDRAPKPGAAPAVAHTATAKAATAQTSADERRLLGDLKTLEARDGEALVRIEGVEQTIRPGMQTKLGRVESISPQRLVLLRAAAEDPKKGETRVVIDLLGAGRRRVRIYASRDWTAEPPRPAE